MEGREGGAKRRTTLDQHPPLLCEGETGDGRVLGWYGAVV